MPGVRFPVAEHIIVIMKKFLVYDTLAEWLRRQPAKLLGSARAGSNPAGVVYYIFAAINNFTYNISMRFVPVAQWIRRETTNLKIAGSNPAGDVYTHNHTVFYSVHVLHSPGSMV